jgi:hypothetical protein
LKRRHVQDPPELGIRVQDAFPAIVSSGDFRPAQEIILARARRFTDDERLDRLRQILPQPGRPSGALIDENENENLPSGAGLRHRFGRPACAHRLIGYIPHTDVSSIETARLLRQGYPAIVQEVG